MRYLRPGRLGGVRHQLVRSAGIRNVGGYMIHEQKTSRQLVRTESLSGRKGCQDGGVRTEGVSGRKGGNETDRPLDGMLSVRLF